MTEIGLALEDQTITKWNWTVVVVIVW